MNLFNQVRWGIIGVGNVTENKSGPAFYKTEYSRLVAVMRRNEEKAADYAQRHQVPKYYSNATELINDPDVDAVYIATPPDSHARYAMEAMKAGKPVYVEKPMAKNYAECLEMLNVSENTGMPIWVAYYRRALPAFLKVKELIDSGTIGKPCMVQVKLHKPIQEYDPATGQMHWHVIPEISGGGYFFDLASHQFDYLDFLFGQVTETSGIASNYGNLYPAEDAVAGIWKHESGVTGSGSWYFGSNNPAEKDEMIITGENGEIVIPCFTHEKVSVKTAKGTTKMEFVNPEHISQNLVQQVVNELRGKGKCVSTGISAARTNWVLEQMVKNFYIK
ncbi:MAG: Gfo/Idh/MocA family oxidoreductase [Mariniphaga sp.]|nr:Gfo/Idh/MocA family oxidoreductase [Mariniphaga sp.]